MGPEFDTTDLDAEEVERRSEVRGFVRGIEVQLPGERRAPALEISRNGFFVSVDDPDVMSLGNIFASEVTRGEVRFSCRVEVVRKEIHPRRGVALRIVRIAPRDEELLRRLVAEA